MSKKLINYDPRRFNNENNDIIHLKITISLPAIINKEYIEINK